MKTVERSAMLTLGAGLRKSQCNSPEVGTHCLRSRKQGRVPAGRRAEEVENSE